MSAHADQSYERGQHASDHGDDHGNHQHGGVRLYVMVALGLVVLTSFSYATHLPFWDSIFGDSLTIKRIWMMAVSCTKAMLVILFFMHLKWEANWKWVLTVPASLMSVLLVLALIPDVALRFMDTWHSGPSRQRLTFAADRQRPDSHDQTHAAEEGAPKGGH
jgi:cytochrome c oxidase subunit 4